MERLTERHYAANDYYLACSAVCLYEEQDCGSCPHIQPIIDQLGRYEDTGLTPEQITAQQWISVAERLPESSQRVIVCRKDGRVEQGIFLGVNGWWKVYGTNTKAVTHWMPMPESPKGD